MNSKRDKIWESALKSVERRMMSTADLRRKLIEKFPEESDLIESVIDQMKELMLIDDKRYAVGLVDHLIQRNIGRLKIKNEARKRGLDEDLIESLLIDAGYNEAEWCRRALADKQVNEEDPRKRKQKLMMFLRGRGFTDRTIYQVL